MKDSVIAVVHYRFNDFPDLEMGKRGDDPVMGAIAAADQR
jgi:hypothetical protein